MNDKLDEIINKAIEGQQRATAEATRLATEALNSVSRTEEDSFMRLSNEQTNQVYKLEGVEHALKDVRRLLEAEKRDTDKNIQTLKIEINDQNRRLRKTTAEIKSLEGQVISLNKAKANLTSANDMLKMNQKPVKVEALGDPSKKK